MFLKMDSKGQRRREQKELKVVRELGGGEKKNLLRNVGNKGERKGLPVGIGTLRLRREQAQGDQKGTQTHGWREVGRQRGKGERERGRLQDLKRNLVC